MKRAILLFTAGISIFALCITSCSKTSTYQNGAAADTSTAVAQDNSQNTTATNDAENSTISSISDKNSPAMQAINFNRNQIQSDSKESSVSTEDSLELIGAQGDSVKIKVSSNGRDSMISDFGKGVISKLDGYKRTGKIISHFSKKFLDPNFADTITFKGYIFNGYALAGTIIITRTSDSTFSRKVIDGKLTYPSGTSSAFFSNVTQIFEGVAPASLIVKEYGTYGGTTQGGISWTGTVKLTDPVIFNTACLSTSGLFPVAGTIDYASSSYKNDRIVNFGKSATACDRTFTVTIGTFVTTVTFVPGSNK